MTAAYAAGLIDGEGCIHIDTTLTPNLDVGMAENALLVLKDLHIHFGGSLSKFREATDKWQAGWSWNLCGKELATLLEELLPHLRLKRGQASAVIELQKLKEATMKSGGTRARWDEASRAAANQLRELVKTMNRRGPEAGVFPAGATVQLVGGRRLLPQLNLFGETPSAECSGTWPTSGMAWSTGSHIACLTVVSSECRSAEDGCSSSEPSLTEILEPPASVPARYSLSARAAQGILRRASKRGRTLPSHLSAALEQVARTTTTDRQAG